MDKSLQSKSKFFTFLWFAVIASTVVITVITIWAELVPSLKTWLGSTFGHHWVGKSIIGIVIFVIALLIGFTQKKPSTDESLAHLIRLTAWVSILSSIVLFCYFVWHTIETTV